MTKNISLSLDNLSDFFPSHFTDEQRARAQTLFLKELAHAAHGFYKGKIQVLPKAPVPAFNWFNVWYTPGVSRVSTAIRDDNDASFELSNRGNLVAVVSDSTRVLGDGDVTPPGGLGVMEGKAFLMKYLGGCDAVALCIDSKDKDGNADPQKVIDFVKMVQHSFGAINLEDISQPNCFKVLDTLREECDIPVWHDDAQGTACVTLAGIINALKLVKKDINSTKMVLYGAGASNTTIARLLMADGAAPENLILFDSQGSLHKGRNDIESDPRFYTKWNLCKTTNPGGVEDIEEAMEGADVLIALSRPGPGVVKPHWIKKMADRPVVFACANPVPEIYPYEAKNAGAYIVATGRGDFPNQVNNSIGFPGILKGALMTRASSITDNMAIAAAHALADYAEKRGITPENIVPNMDEAPVFPEEAAAVAVQAVKDGVARRPLSYEKALEIAKKDITLARETTQALTEGGFIQPPPQSLIDNAFEKAMEQMKKA